MNAEFNWWLLIVGLVVGAGLVWLVVADSRRREIDIAEGERAGEARWIAAVLDDVGRPVDGDDVLAILRLHAAYLAAPPPDPASDDALDHPSTADPADPVAGDGPIGRSRVGPPDPGAVERRVMAHPIARDGADRERGPA